VALVLENAGWGADSAAPIARRVLDYWIKGIYPTDKDIAAVQGGNAGGPPLEPGVPIAQATNIRLGTNHSPNADESIGTPLEGADNLAGAMSAVAGFDAASAASAPSAAARASAAAAARDAAAAAALVNAGSGSIAVAASAAAKRQPAQWTPTAKPGKHQP